MTSKLSIIDEYIKTRPPENDTVSETYRGGVNEIFYIPLSTEEVKDKWRNFLSNNSNPLIDFYIHIPFCYKKCNYCFYYKEVYEKEKLDNYIEYLELYLGEFIDIFKGVNFKSLYFGGGTPTLLSVEQINRLLTFINNNFTFLEGAEITFEGNPLSFSKEKIETITRLGVNRISMGVQSLDYEVLKSSNREYQNIGMITDSMKNLRKNGIKNINIDLIMGLKDDTVEKFGYTIQEIIKMNPYSITIYWLGPTKGYLDKYYGGNIEMFFQDINSKTEDYYNHIMSKRKDLGDNVLLNIDKDNGHIWNITMNNNNDKHLKYCYNDFGEGSLFGVGPSSRSHIFGELVYKTINDLDYTITTRENLLSEIINIGDYIDNDDEISLYVITEIRDRLFINHTVFKEKFGLEFTDYFKDELNHFLSNNLVIISKNETSFMLDIDKRLYYSMFFISEKRLMEKNIVNEKNNNLIINYDKKEIKFMILVYFNNGVKFRIINMDSNPSNEHLLNKNINYYYVIIKKIGKIISILNRDKKELPYCIKALKILLNNI